MSLGLKEESELAHCNEQFHFGRLLFPLLFPLLLPYLRQLSGGGEKEGVGGRGRRIVSLHLDGDTWQEDMHTPGTK